MLTGGGGQLGGTGREGEIYVKVEEYGGFEGRGGHRSFFSRPGSLGGVEQMGGVSSAWMMMRETVSKGNRKRREHSPPPG